MDNLSLEQHHKLKNTNTNTLIHTLGELDENLARVNHPPQEDGRFVDRKHFFIVISLLLTTGVSFLHPVLRDLWLLHPEFVSFHHPHCCFFHPCTRLHTLLWVTPLGREFLK